MGKFNKKIKSDRINALRKQYDAFLEDDKKRKERNEYILGRLDKMRYSNALVPVRSKLNTHDNRLSVTNHLGHQPDCSSVRDLQHSNTTQRQLFPDIQVNNNENAYLIQEISKKYILIPKLRSSILDHYIHNMTPNENAESVQDRQPVENTIPKQDVKLKTNENTDWQSKYEILNLLKNEEKEMAKTNIDNNTGVFESNINNDQEQLTINYDNINRNVHIKTANNYLNEWPENDVSHDTLNNDSKHNIECSKNNTEDPKSDGETNTFINKNNVMISNENPADIINCKLQSMKLDFNQTDASVELSAEVTNYEKRPDMYANMLYTDTILPADTYIKNEIPEVDPVAYNHKVSVEQDKSADSEPVFYLNDNETSQIHVANSERLVNELVPESVVGELLDVEEKHLSEVGNLQEFITPTTQTEINVDVDKLDKLEISTHIDPTYEIDDQVNNTDDQQKPQVDVSASIEEFNEEMNYYAEETGKNFTYQQGDETFDSEYPQKDCQPNQEYSYYEGVQPEAYPVGEHDQDEVTQRYDPNYEQQYSNQESVRQPQQQYEQQPQQNEAPEGYKQPLPELKTLPYEQQNYEALEEVEQVQDVEGYFEQQHVAERDEKTNVEAVAQQHFRADDEIKQPDTEEVRESKQFTG